jgi:hypothetical protein
MNYFSRLHIYLLLLLISFVIISNQSIAQNDKKVRISPKAEVIQTVGFTDIKIDYNRPGVKGREIWGGLVPYEKVWRAGANEATKFTFSTDVNINGVTLKAGSYSFFVIPTKDKWTLIFNNVADQWGAFEYNEAEDALRFEVTPEEGCMQEWLVYTITKTSENSAVVKLEWEKLTVPFTIEVSLN